MKFDKNKILYKLNDTAYLTIKDVVALTNTTILTARKHMLRMEAEKLIQIDRSTRPFRFGLPVEKVAISPAPELNDPAPQPAPQKALKRKLKN